MVMGGDSVRAMRARWEWVFFARMENCRRGPREWATCGSVPYFVIRRRAGENGVQTIVPPERAYVGDRP